jgi:hypothetical protein
VASKHSISENKCVPLLLFLCATISTTISNAQYAGPFDDELGLSAEEQRRKNNASYAEILVLVNTHNVSLIAGFAPSYTVSAIAETTNIVADNSLKFAKAYLVPPPNIALYPNTVEPGGTDLCSYTIELPRTKAKFDNFLGLWPKLGNDAILNPFDAPVTFGELGTPTLYHAHTDVILSLTGFTAGIDPDAGVIESGSHEYEPVSQSIPIPVGAHQLEWRADNVWYPVWDWYMPTALSLVMVAVEFKFAKYIDELKKSAKGSEELISIKTDRKYLKKLLDKVDKKAFIYEKIGKLLIKASNKGLDFGINKAGDLDAIKLIDLFFTERLSVSRARLQNVDIYDIYPPTISTSMPIIPLEATDIGGTRLSRYIQEFNTSITASDRCGRPVVVTNNAEEVLPLGDTIVTWTVRDAGPALPGIDHDDDGAIDTNDYFSRTLTQILRVEDTQDPILVPPPGLVFESTTDLNLSQENLGQPLVVDLADLNPDVSKSAPDPFPIAAPNTRTVVTWSATDHATTPHTTTGEQLITVKLPNTNMAPTAQANITAETITSRPVNIVLTGVDPDLLPYSHDPTGPTVPDPLQFRIESPPQNGEFEAQLLPFFIDDYRTDETGGLISYINSQPDAEQLMAKYVLAVTTNNVGNFINNEFCALDLEAPVDFVNKPLYVHVTEEGEQYFFDHYFECNPDIDTEWAENQRLSRWDSAGNFVGHVYISDNNTNLIRNNKASIRIDAENHIYYIDDRVGGEPVVMAIRCPADFTDQSSQPPQCQGQPFGPIDAGDISGNGVPRWALVDIARELIYLTTDFRVEVFDFRRENPNDPSSNRKTGSRITALLDDLGNPDILSASDCSTNYGIAFDGHLDMDSAGNLYVIDNACNRVHKFSQSSFDENGVFVPGDYVGWLGRCSGSNNQACDLDNLRTKGFSCTAAASCTVAGGVSEGDLIGQFKNAANLAVDPNDILYVADYGNSRIQRFDADGTFAGQAASTGNGINADIDGGFVLGNMGPPKHVSVNSKKFFVVDQSEHFVHVFDASPFKNVTDSSATVTYVSKFAFHSATDTFSYSVNDGLVDSNIAAVTIDVARNYRQPIPTPQLVTIEEDGTAVIVITGSDPDGVLTRDFNGLDTLTVEVTRQPEHGVLTEGGDTGELTIDASMQVWTYTPGADFFGTDAFEFTVRDEFTDADFDGQTAIPEPYGIAEPGQILIDVTSVNDIPIINVTPTATVAAGFPMMLNGIVYDDFGTVYDATVSWGDGEIDRNGKIVVNNNGTPNDFSDDSIEMTGVIFSSEGLNNVGASNLNATHTFMSTGSRTIRLCFRDFGQLESCELIDVMVEDRVAMGVEFGLSDDEIGDGIFFYGEIKVVNAEPIPGVGGLNADNVVLNVEIPPDIIVNSISSSDGTCNVSTNLLECSFGTMSNGAAAIVDLELRGSGVLVYDADVTLEAEVTTDTPALEDTVASSAAIKISAVDLDRDGDGLSNIFEASNNVTDPDADDDGDGLTNQEEFEAGTQADDQDSDGDGISDGDELSLYDSDPLQVDSDDDGLPDADEINIHGTDPVSRDSDNDGLPDDWELDNGYDPVVNDSGGDADADGLSDRDEFANGSDYLVADTDGDTLDDGPEVHVYGSDPTKEDSDDDGLNDDAEIVAGTQVNKPDTDDDALGDGTEVYGTLTRPLLADTDRDGLQDGFEDFIGRDPLFPDYRLAAGGLSTCAITDDGVNCWGLNDSLQAPALVAGLNDPQQVTMGEAHGCAVDRATNGTRSVVCWGDNAFSQSDPVALTEPVAVAAGASHTCALDRTGPTTTEVRCWGKDDFGQVSTAPTNLVQPLRLVSSISGNSSCVLDDATTGPELVCWGQYNSANTSSPIGFDNDVGALALGSEHGCIIDGGQQLCWGLNDDDQAPSGPVESSAVELSLGGFHSCALNPGDPDEYSIACWGLGTDGQTAIPESLANPLSLASGSHHSCAFDEGSAKCWGQDNDGQASATRTLEIDPDGDGIFTADEIADGTSPVDPDTDRDGASDSIELGLGTDPTNSDSDDDGIIDGDEVNVYGTNPLSADTDGDGTPDKWEIDNALPPTVADGGVDTDGDGLRNVVEYANDTDPHSTDTDDDGLDDAAELAVLALVSSGQAIGSLISEAVNLGDIDDDGDLDAVVANRAGGNMIWLNDRLGTFSESPQGALNLLEAVDVDLGDVDGDGDLDIALAHPLFTDSNTVWLNGNDDNVLGVFADSGYDFGTATSDAVKFTYSGASLDRVGFFAANWGQSTHFDFVGGILQAGQVTEFSAGNSEDVAIGDLNGDGLNDAFIVNRDQPNDVLTGRLPEIPTRFGTTEQQLGNSSSIAVALGDIDNDGDLDAYEAIAGAGDRIWLNDGLATFTDSGQVLGSNSANDVALIDIDNDGDLDALVANSVTNRLWLNAGDGTLSDSGHTFGGGLSFGLGVGDLNGDELPDIFVADDGANSVWFLSRLDPAEPDSDGDGAFDGWELTHGFDPLDDRDGNLDPDGDGLTNAGEFDAGTDPLQTDSDGDVMPDGWEVENGLDPTIDDSAGDLDRDGLNNLDEYLQGMAVYGDDVAPLLNVPADTGADSIGPFTNVPLGNASAVDVRDGMVVPVADDPGPYVPGSHVITWSADDLSGNRAQDSQSVDVVPYISFAVDQTADEGSSIVAILTLNGAPIVYPVQIDYIVAGVATNPDDHDAANDSVIINSGSTSAIPINVALDGVFEGPESFTLTITNVVNAVVGPQDSHTVTIAESNAQPIATISASQDTIPVTTAAADGGLITVSADVVDPNPTDSHSYDWSSSDSGAFDPADAADASYSIDPSTLNPGFYRIAVAVSDNGSPIAMNEADMLLRIIATAPSLVAENDSDSDGVDDVTEGLADIDNDRISKLKKDCACDLVRPPSDWVPFLELVKATSRTT